MRDPSKEQEALGAVNELDKETQESSVVAIQGNLESTAGEEKDSDTLSNAESTAGGSTKNGTKTKSMTDDLGTGIEPDQNSQELSSAGSKSKGKVLQKSWDLRSQQKILAPKEDASEYESDGDDNTWTQMRRSNKMKRYNGREELVNSGKVVVPGSEEMHEEFRSYVMNVKHHQKATAVAYSLHLFLRKDNKSLLSYCSGQNDNFHASNLTNFEDDTGVYVQVPSHTDWVYGVLPSKDPRQSSQQ